MGPYFFQKNPNSIIGEHNFQLRNRITSGYQGNNLFIAHLDPTFVY